jgi:hypothetical protein
MNNPERKQPIIDQEKVSYIHQKLRFFAREIETNADIRRVFQGLYDVSEEQMVEFIKVIISRDSRLLIVPGHSPIELSDFTPEIDAHIRDMLTTMLGNAAK